MSRAGTVVISVDAELGWGFHHFDAIPDDRVRAGRSGWEVLLQLFSEYRTPATWAVVGHLMLDRCEDVHRNHPAGERCCARGGADLSPEDVWFGPDLVDAIRDADLPHEVACHGHTHVHFQHDAMTRAGAREELAASRTVASDRGMEPTSFVYPVNRPKYRDLLAEYGFECYRGPGPNRGAVGKVKDAIAGRAAPIVHPSTDDHGLVNVPGSLYLYGFEGPARSVLGAVNGDPVVAQVRGGLGRLAEEPGVLHLWLHPHNLRERRDVQRMRSVLDAIQAARMYDGVRVETMGSVARGALVEAA